MCGLFGAMGPSLSKRDKEAVTWLGTLTQERGKDSTGLVTVHRKGKNFGYKLRKDTVAAPLFIGSKPVKDMLEKDPIVIAGHCRWATHGSIKFSNAHPFAVGHYIGMHNGIMPSLYDRINDKTDTEVLFDNMMKEGIEKGIQSGLAAGCMALVFINKSNGTLNYYRDGDRPLFIGIEKSKKKFFWASSKDYLDYVEKKGYVTFDSIYNVAPHLLHSIPIGKTERHLTEIKPKPRLYSTANWPSSMRSDTSFRPIERVPYTEPPGHLATAPMSYARGLIPIIGKVTAVVPSASGDGDSSSVFFRGYKGNFMEVKAARQVLRAANSSCDCCGTGFRMLDPIHWINEKEWVCDECANDRDVTGDVYAGVPMYRGYWIRKDGTPIQTKGRKKIEKPYNDIPF